MANKHTHWGVEHLTNSSGRRPGWRLSLQSIRPTRQGSRHADLDHYISLNPLGNEDRWQQWHDLRKAGKMRSVKLRIVKVDA